MTTVKRRSVLVIISIVSFPGETTLSFSVEVVLELSLTSINPTTIAKPQLKTRGLTHNLYPLVTCLVFPSNIATSKPSTMPDEHRPLLSSGRRGTPASLTTSARRQTKRFLTSRAGHYYVLILVSLDVSGIFADLILQLVTCEGRVPLKDSNKAQTVLGIVSMVFSCLFMAELVASMWAFSVRRVSYYDDWAAQTAYTGDRFFYSWFHCLDATVITASFVVDVVLRGVVKEVGSLIIVLRLFRVFKVRSAFHEPFFSTRLLWCCQIIEELSAGAEEQMEPLHERIQALEKANHQMQQEISELRRDQEHVV